MKYEAAEGVYPKDGLSVLRKHADASAVVVSFGVLDGSILKSLWRNPRLASVADRYVAELIEEIHRGMSPFAIIVGNHAEKYLGMADVPHESVDLGGVYFKKP